MTIEALIEKERKVGSIIINTINKREEMAEANEYIKSFNTNILETIDKIISISEKIDDKEILEKIEKEVGNLRSFKDKQKKIFYLFNDLKIDFKDFYDLALEFVEKEAFWENVKNKKFKNEFKILEIMIEDIIISNKKYVVIMEEYLKKFLQLKTLLEKEKDITNHFSRLKKQLNISFNENVRINYVLVEAYQNYTDIRNYK
jgi:hypothetical protein